MIYSSSDSVIGRTLNSLVRAIPGSSLQRTIPCSFAHPEPTRVLKNLVLPSCLNSRETVILCVGFDMVFSFCLFSRGWRVLSKFPE